MLQVAEHAPGELIRPRLDVIFCDVDDTIIRGKSLLGFAECLVGALSVGQAASLNAQLGNLIAGLKRGDPRAELNRRYYEAVVGGRTVNDVRRIARSWYDEASARPGFYKRSVCEFLAGMRASGARVVLLTGSFCDLVQPIAEHVGAVEILAAPLEVRDARYTGRLLTPPTVDRGKLLALSSYAEANGLVIARCGGVGDDVSDLPFLTAVGRPFVPSDGQIDLLRHAAENGWNVLSDVV